MKEARLSKEITNQGPIESENLIIKTKVILVQD